MHRLTLFIYCQPLHRIVFFIFLLVFFWAYLAYREDNSLRSRLANGILFVGMVAVILYMTVYTRGEGTSETILRPFQSFQEAKIQPELYRSMLMNVFLFVPLGLSLPFVLGRGRFPGFITVVVALAFSAGIEYLQYRYALGRCEMDDVIMNTLGATVGCLAHWLFLNWERLVIPGWHLLSKRIRWLIIRLRNLNK